MKGQDTISIAREIMMAFADSTGLSTERSPRRYLWTDAFAVCNFLELYGRTGDKAWRDLALRLVDQVHHVLGRHRQDDPRIGWISGLTEEEGERHPTIGGLRIGKGLNERRPAEPYDERLEWDRDGQYYHYLTRWMHALNRVSRTAQDPVFNSWAMELAKAAHQGFVHVLSNGSRRMFWKMSIDLFYPLVTSMGQHDPLDGLLTYCQLQATADERGESSAVDLHSEIDEMTSLCRGKDWSTEDPLGIGGLLCDAYKMVLLILNHRVGDTGLLGDVLESALSGMGAYSKSPMLRFSADYRLAFRELGMAIGLDAVKRMALLITENPEAFIEDPSVHSRVRLLEFYAPLAETIKTFWLEAQNRKARSWTEHQDINTVTLATCLAPDGYLGL
jgi:hypothetical protein